MIKKYNNKIVWSGLASAVTAFSVGQVSASADVQAQDASLKQVNVNALVDTTQSVINITSAPVKTSSVNVTATSLPISQTTNQVVSDEVSTTNTPVITVKPVNATSEVSFSATAFSQLNQALNDANLIGNSVVLAAADAKTADLNPKPLPENNGGNTGVGVVSSTSGTGVVPSAAAKALPQTGAADETYLSIIGSLTMAVAMLSMAGYIFRRRAL
jgi:LPXTG-motif cell wall-anchored protein